MSRREKGIGGISQRADGRWVGRIDVGITIDGKRKIKSVYGKTKQEAQRKLKEVRDSLTRGEYMDRKPKDHTIQYYADEWLQLRKHEIKSSTFDTIESNFINIIYPRIGIYQFDKVTPKDIQGFIDKLVKDGYSYSIVKKMYYYLKAIYEFFYDRKEILDIPFKRIVLPKKLKKESSSIVFFNEEEIKKIKECALSKYPNGTYVFRSGYAIILLLYTGLRCGELIGLKWANIDFDNKQIKVESSIREIKDRSENAKQKTKFEETTPKTSSSIRIVPLSDMAIEALRYFESIKSNDIYVVTTSTGSHITNSRLNRAFHSILDRCGIEKKAGVHSLRHTFASMLFKKGVDAKTVSEILGHSDISITYDIYIHIIDEQKRKAIEQLNDM